MEMEGKVGEMGSAGEQIGQEMEMRPLHPNQLRVLQIRFSILVLFLLAITLPIEIGVIRESAIPTGLLFAATLLAGLVGLFLLPGRRYRAWGFREEEDELHIRYGLLIRVRTSVPFARVQHIDVAQGPIERRFGLARLILHTAGTRSAHLPLPGLLHSEAEAMRDRIRAKIRLDLL